MKRYLAIEGLDGSGKSTLAKALAARLRWAGHTAYVTSFPSEESAIGGFIRDAFSGRVKIHREALLWLFVAEAKDMEQRIRDLLADNVWVICDRHTLASARVYQAAIHGESKVESVIWPAGLLVPDRVYLLDVPAEVALERRRARGEDRNEDYEPDDLRELDVQRRGYRNLFDQFIGARLLDGTHPTGDLVNEILRDLGQDTAKP